MCRLLYRTTPGTSSAILTAVKLYIHNLTKPMRDVSIMKIMFMRRSHLFFILYILFKLRPGRIPTVDNVFFFLRKQIKFLSNRIQYIRNASHCSKNSTCGLPLSNIKCSTLLDPVTVLLQPLIRCEWCGSD